MSTIRIGIMPPAKMREMTIAIAKGEFKPKRNWPTIWFPSMKALSEVLSDRNRELLRVIAEQHPDSIKELAELTGRKPNNVSRTLDTMQNYGLVEFKQVKRCRKPVVKGTEFLIQAS